MGNQDEVVLCDTNIILEFLKGNERITKELETIRKKNIRISVITSMEIIYGALNKKELQQLVKTINRLHVIQVTPEISQLASEMMIDFTLSHNLDISDSTIAATAIMYDLPIYTLNLKDFRYIPNLRLYEPIY